MRTSPHVWSTGDYLSHRFNPELGIGQVTSLERRAVVVSFPRAGTTLRIAIGTDALVPVDLSPGRPVRRQETPDDTRIVGTLTGGLLALADGSTARAHELWPLELEGALAERLALGQVDDPADVLMRLRVLHLLAVREADGLGSFLGGRIRLFPHQIYTALKATERHPVRWLLADEVGLGKTIEAALILNHLVHTSRIDRALVVAPEALTVQWLGELWRKYHQVFTLLDTPRLADVARDFGGGANPFDLHKRAVIALELLVERPELTHQAVSAGIDLLVVDEAQHLRRRAGHPGDPAWRAVAPIAALGRHVVFLSATPLHDDAHGFFRLLQLLRPADFPGDRPAEAARDPAAPLPACVSSTRRSDIGGLPPRVARPVSLDVQASLPRLEVEALIRRRPASDHVALARKLDRVRRSLASGAALAAVLGPDETALRQQATAMDTSDPRVRWLLTEAPKWRAAADKTLIFVEHRDTLEMLRTALSHGAQLATGVFHEVLSSARRDIEVARFREPEGPSLLVSTECGGEGRNFEFCTRLVLFDLPWEPSTVEQRIGRLDRIGRRTPVEIVYFRPPNGIGLDVVRCLEQVGLFQEPLTGRAHESAEVRHVLEDLAAREADTLSDADLAARIGQARSAPDPSREAAARALYRDPYHADMAADILRRVPIALDELNEAVILDACSRLGFTIERVRGESAYAIEIGKDSEVDGLPGVPWGSTFVGTFDRDEAVSRENIDFFASGHPLIEGVFAHVDDSPRGRVGRIWLTLGEDAGRGLVAIYKDHGHYEVIALDAAGHPRPEWAEAVRTYPETLGSEPDQSMDADQSALVRRLSTHLDPSRPLHAIATLVVRPSAP